MKIIQKILDFLLSFLAKHTPDIKPVVVAPHITPPSPTPAPVSSKVDLWCQAITKMEGANPKNNNPGNLEYHAQPGTIDKNGRFAMFGTYQEGYQALKTLLIRACEGKSALYDPNGDLVAFYNVYAPSSDNNNPIEYAKFVAKFIGCPVETPIKNLL